MASNEFFQIGPDRLPTDVVLHRDMLDNPEADEKQRRRAIVNVIAKGMSREDATHLYGEIPIDLAVEPD